MNITLHWPQAIYLTLVIVTLVATARLHGEDRTGVYSFWVVLFNNSLLLLLLYKGGFFVFGI